MSRAFVWLALLALALGPAACSGGRPAPDFTLRDDSGNAWQLSQQRGKAVLLTFGYTHCSDTCPTTLAKLARVTGALGERSKEVQVAFVTIDPARDTPAVLHRFLARFVTPHSSALVGLTGTPAQIASTEAAYHVYASRMVHSTVIFSIDAGGRLRAMHDDGDSAQALLKSVRRLLG